MKKILSFFAVMLFAFAVNAATTVSPTAEKNNLSAAVAAATAGDVLELTNGIFNEEGNFAIDKDLTIKAAEGAKPIIKNLYYFRVESGAKVTFQGIEFDGSGASDHCLRSHNGSNGSEEVTLDNCSFHNYPSYVLYTQRNSRKWHSLTIKNCYFYDNVKYAIAIIYEGSTATTCDAVSVENSTFANTTGNYAAIYIQDGNATELSVDHCTFYNFGAPFIKADASATSIDIANSIFAQPEAKTTAPVVCSAGTVKNCLAFNTADYAEGPTVTGGIAADPKFEDAANGSFYLAEDSPARNAGTDSKTLGDQRWWEKPKMTAPDAAPAAPEWPANQVKAVYSATYNADCGFGEWGSGTVYAQDTYGKKYTTTALGYFGLLFEGDNSLNCAKMEKLHLDVWVAADASIRVVPIWKAGGAEKGVTCEVKGQQWNAIDIALTEYDNVTDWSNIYQIKIDNAPELTFWVNNVYFYTTQVPEVDTEAPSEFTAVAGDASYFSAAIKAKAKDASEAVMFDVINGELVVATAKAGSEVETVIQVKNLTPNTEYNFSVIAKDETGNSADPIAVSTKTLEAPAAAETPEFEPEKVKSIYSDVYTTATAISTLNAGWWEPSEMSEGYLAEGNKALFYAPKATGMFGWEIAETDMTGFPYMHVSIYPIADGSIKIYPVVKEGAGDYNRVVSVKGGEWNELVLDYTGLDLSKVYQIGWIDYYKLNGFFVDNVYFSATAKPIKPQANIFASGLKGALSADGSQFEIEYFLNANATEIEVEFFNAEGEMELKTPLTIAEQLTAGAHKVSIEMSPSETFDPGTYSWTIHAYAGPTEFKDMLPADDNRYNYYMPMSIVVDNSFESDFFGRVYVSESVDGADDGASDATKQQVRGIYIYNPDMNFANGQEMAVLGYDGGLLGDRTSSAGFRRLAIDAKGNVYVASLDDATKGVYRMDPANPAADFVTVLQAERPVDALEIVGDTLYTIENVAESSGEFDIYDMTTIPVGKPVKRMLTTAADSDKGLANSFITLRSDGRGGFWVAQHRWGPTPYPPFEHWNSNREVDFKIDGENSEILGDITGNVSYRGQIAVNVAGDKIALGSNKCAKVFSVTYGDDGVPVLTFICMTPQFGNNIDGLAFDVADNLYVASASVERFYQFPLAKEEGANHTRVYAPSKYNLVIKEEDAVDNINATVAPTKVIRNGQVLIIRDGVEYNVLGAEMR
jgi:hypothetical protein